MNDRELLELAAKAAGIEGAYKTLHRSRHDHFSQIRHFSREAFVSKGLVWDPLNDDGDALRLAVLLSLRVEPYTGVKIHDRYPVANITDVYSLHSYDVKLSELHGLDPAAATRRAIVRAAAEIGKSMECK